MAVYPDKWEKVFYPMLEAMMKAKVGDDVFGEEISINELEVLSARMLGIEAALFVLPER